MHVHFLGGKKKFQLWDDKERVKKKLNYKLFAAKKEKRSRSLTTPVVQTMANTSNEGAKHMCIANKIIWCYNLAIKMKKKASFHPVSLPFEAVLPKRWKMCCKLRISGNIVVSSKVHSSFEQTIFLQTNAINHWKRLHNWNGAFHLVHDVNWVGLLEFQFHRISQLNANYENCRQYCFSLAAFITGARLRPWFGERLRCLPITIPNQY